MELKIYSQNGTLKLIVSPSSSSTVTEEVMGECSASVNFVYSDYVPLDVNDYIILGSVRYRIKSQYRPTKEHSSKYVYNVKFWAPIHDAEDVLFLFTADGEMQSEFSYDASPREHLQMWVDNMNRNAGSAVWSIGTVITANNKMIEYKNMYCWDAAFGSNGIAAAFETELWADGFVINLCKAERGERVSLGYLQGLTKLVPAENPSAKFFTRLYPLGSTRNIDAAKYGYSRLQLPSKVKYLDRNTELYGIKDGYEEAAFADIYPRFIGTVSSVRTVTKTNESEREYTVYYIKDNTIDFNPNDYDLPEHIKKVSFQTGDLAGHGDTEGSFEANWLQESKEWEIINVYPDEKTQIPGGVLIPKVGDSYIPWNFSMPSAYITAAEKEFEVAVNTFLQDCSFDPTKYEGQTDRNYIEKNSISLFIGLNVQLISPEYFVPGTQESRIIKVVRKLNDLYNATITCSDKTSQGWKSSVDNSISDLKFKVSKNENGSYDIIKTTDSKTPSDVNVFSALRSLTTFLRKDKNDQTTYLLKLLAGANFGDYIPGHKGAKIDSTGAAEFASALIRNLLTVSSIESHKFTPGMAGAGFALHTDANDGSTSFEVDYLIARRKAVFNSLSVHDVEHVGGELVISPAAMIISKVEDNQSGWKCYFNQKDAEGRRLYNEFKVNDQARCQTFNLGSLAAGGPVENKFWWRLVTEVGEDYIVVSRSDAAVRSGVPSVGDNVSQLGNRTDKTRQNAQVLSSYGSDSPSRKMYQGINSYDLTDKMVWGEFYDPKSGQMKSTSFGSSFIGNKDKSSYMSYSPEEGLKVKGKIFVTGKDGNEKEVNEDMLDIKIGSENLLRNTAFTGNYRSVELSPDSALSEDTDLYSPALEYWRGKAKVIQDNNAAARNAVILGSISQSVYLISNESYIMSLQAKGTSLTIDINGVQNIIDITNKYVKYELKFIGSATCDIKFTGAATICDIKLERGTVGTDWCPHREDRNEVADEFRKLWYLMNALAGTTEIDGGMILSSIIRMGMWQDGKLKQENAGISGIYNNDSDVAFYAGGSLEQAIDTVSLYREDPLYVPSESEMRNIANVVITHGGLAILSNVILRGWIFAEGGVFRGSVFADGGVFKNIKNPNGYFEIDGEGKLTAVDARFTGTLKRPWVTVMPEVIYSKVDPVTGQAIDVQGYLIPPGCYDRVKLIGLTQGDFYPDWSDDANGRDVMVWNDSRIVDGSGRDIKVNIKEGCTIYDKGAVYTYKDTYFIRGKTIVCMTAAGNSWIVTNIIDFNKTELQNTLNNGNTK